MSTAITYTEIYNAVDVLWPNVIDIDYFIEKLTDEQIELITRHINGDSYLTYTP